MTVEIQHSVGISIDSGDYGQTMDKNQQNDTLKHASNGILNSRNLAGQINVTRESIYLKSSSCNLTPHHRILDEVEIPVASLAVFSF